MASWKKVIVSGSQAHLAAVTASNLTVANELVKAGSNAGNLVSTTGMTFNGGTLALGSNNITSTANNSVLTGSFSGSFTGTFSGVSSTLNVSASNGSNGTVNLTTEALTITGTSNEIETSMADQTLTIGLPDDVTILNDLTVGGNLTVNGTTTTINTENLLVEDKFILLASGSAVDTDGGIIIQNNSAGTGYGLFYDSVAKRWAVSENTAHTITDATPTYFVGFVTSSVAAPSATAPSYASTTAYGTMHIDTVTNDGEIWIYA